MHLLTSLVLASVFSLADVATGQGEILHLKYIKIAPHDEGLEVPGKPIVIINQWVEGKNVIEGRKTNRNQDLIWSYPCEERCDLKDVGQDVVVLQTNGDYRHFAGYRGVMALEVETGKILWHKVLEDFLNHRGFVVEKEENSFLVGFQAGPYYYRYHTLTGKLENRFRTQGKLVIAPQRQQGRILWSYEGAAFNVTDANGKIIWQWELEKQPADREIDSRIEEFFLPTPQILGVAFKAVNFEGKYLDFSTRFFEFESGKLVLTLPPGRSVVMDQDHFYIKHSSQRKISSYDRKTLKKNWETNDEKAAYSGLAITPDYILSADERLNLYDKKTGQLLDFIEAPGVGTCAGSGGMSRWFWSIAYNEWDQEIVGHVANSEGEAGLCEGYAHYQMIHPIMQ